MITEPDDPVSYPASLVVVDSPVDFRPLEIAYDGLTYTWTVPSPHYIYACRSRDQFVAATGVADGHQEKPSSALELLARYLLFLIAHDQSWSQAPLMAREGSIAHLFGKLETDFLRGSNIHTLASQLPGSPRQRQTVIQAYMAAMAYTDGSHQWGEKKAALFSPCTNQSTKTYAIFGGQGNTVDLFDELRQLFTTYTHFVKPLLVTAERILSEILGSASITQRRQYHKGLAILQWLERPETTPDQTYLLSSPVSFPLIGLIQLTNYAVVCRCLNKSPGAVAEHLLGMTGHSQGIVVAAALAVVTTWESFDEAVEKSLTILLHIGSAAQKTTPLVSIPSAILEESMRHGEGVPSPMLNVTGFRREKLQGYISETNKHLEPEYHVAIGLINGSSNFVVSGPTLSLCALTSRLRQVKAPPGANQCKIAFSLRKPEFSQRFLPVSAPFHSTHLRGAAALAVQELCRLHIPAHTLRLPVYHSRTGVDLRTMAGEDVIPSLVDMILCEMDDWPLSTSFRDATHVLDFGPGGLSGTGSLLHRNKEGTGVRVVLAGLADGNSTEFGYRAEVFASEAVFNDNWVHKYSPRLVQSTTGQIQIGNRMTQLLGVPPVMVAGMTPTTVSWEFVNAIMHAGYHVELAAGGLHTADQLTTTIRNLAGSMPRGRGICVNVIYASPRQIRWQIPLIQKLGSEGMPIDGLTFGAGVPSIEAAKEYMELGLAYLSFKPGSAPAINQVISIAKSAKNHPIILQWTGGRGGGHHSFEDFHEPMLQLYGRIRQCPNILLLAGSGFGGAEDSYPYLSGSWSEPFGRPRMPFDGILVGSRVMVAKEAKTSQGCKEAIVAAPGVQDESLWEQTYSRPTGGIITVKSEMGEPIHKVATRGVLLWKELDDKIFSIADKSKRLGALKEMRPYIIQRLNRDFQKVWFGIDSLGNPVDLEAMTYGQVLRRMVQLLYVSQESRWIDPSYMRLTADFVRRMLGRLLKSMPPFNLDFGLDKPHSAVSSILSQCPVAQDQLVSYSDARYFVLLCKRPGQKPPTFLVDMDQDFEICFKKDSLWQSEDLGAVVGEDAGRTCILQGPVAAKYSVQVDEPVGEILDSINHGYIARILKDSYANDKRAVPQASPGLTPTSITPFTPADCIVRYNGNKTQYQIANASEQDSRLPDAEEWLRGLAGRPGTWLHALLTCSSITQGCKTVSNPVCRALSPTWGMHVEVTEARDPEDLAIRVFELDMENQKCAMPEPSMVIHKDQDICVTLYSKQNIQHVQLPLTFRFTHHPQTPLHPVHEVMEGRESRLRMFYHRLWFGSSSDTCSTQQVHHGLQPLFRPFDTAMPFVRANVDAEFPMTRYPHTVCLPCGLDLIEPLGVHDASFNTAKLADCVFQGRRQTISSSSIQDFVNSTVPSDEIKSLLNDKHAAPLDFAIVVAWEAMMTAIFPSCIDGDFLSLVHLSNKLRVLNDSAPLFDRDEINTTAEILAIRDEPAGRVVEVGAIIERDGCPVLELVSEFLFRGSYTSSGVCFEKRVEPRMCVFLESSAKVAVLESKTWIQLLDPRVELLGQTLIFELKSIKCFGADANIPSLHTFGQVYCEHADTKLRRMIATVQYQCGRASGNQVMDYLNRHGSPVDALCLLENPQPLGQHMALEVTTPKTNHSYALASGDYNPIHASHLFARYANLPGAITHGMFTSAVVRQLVEKATGTDGRVGMRSYKASFVNMVLPGSTLKVHVSHVAMRQGLRVLSFQALDVHTGERVLEGEAEVDQPASGYVFTGQGSQTQNMGMDLYATCQVARATWDAADKFYSETYGFLISDIVKRNPAQLTVHFGGRRGHNIRQNYMDMMVENNGNPEPLFKSISHTTEKHTFQNKAGLLFSTEFAQPALTIVGHAQFLHLKSKGLIDNQALFAGHSLGEYTALGTIGAIMPFDTLLSVVFYRGLTMQSAVSRDAHGRSNFSMMAINPSRISRSLSSDAIQAMVAAVAAATGDLLELVNYNVVGQQYVAAGTLAALDCLAGVANHMAAHPADFQYASPEASAHMDAVVAECAAQVSLKTLPIQLERGVATTPLEAIDVPFHSSFLLAKMPAFRRVLQKYITPEAIDARRLVGKYVSNVTGKAFDISYQGVQEAYEKTGSEVLRDLLLSWEGSVTPESFTDGSACTE